MSTSCQDGKGFGGLAGWMVENGEDLALARSAVRQNVALPPSAESPLRVPPTPRLADRPAAEPKKAAPSQRTQSSSGGVVAVLAILGVVVVLVIASTEPVNYGTNVHSAPADSAADTSDAVAPNTGGGGLPVADAALAYVTAENANVRAGANGNSPVVGTLPQMSQVAVMGREGSWSRIGADVYGVQLEGYIYSELLHEGRAEEARAIICGVRESSRPYNGEVLLQAGYGEHHLTVNAGARDALVKLRSMGETTLAFYVRAGESGSVQSVPNGTYQVMFATGDGFSRKCLEFVTSMAVSSDPSPVTFEVTSDGYYEYYSTATYTLTEHVGGNFRPQPVDDNAFRE